MQRRLGASPVILTSLDELVDRGSRLPPSPLSTDGDVTRVAMVSHGCGAVLTEEELTHLWSRSLHLQDLSPVVGLTFIPRHHVAALLPVMAALRSGGTTYFGTDADPAAVLDDLAIVRPHELGLMPSTVELLARQHTTLMRRALADGADPETAHLRADRRLRDEVLGGRVIRAWIAGPPLSRELQQFTDRVLGRHVVAVPQPGDRWGKC